MGCHRRETGWRRQIVRGPVERQSHGPEQSDPRAEAGCQFPHGSKERRETRPRGHQGRVLVRDSWHSRQTDCVLFPCRAYFSPPFPSTASAFAFVGVPRAQTCAWGSPSTRHRHSRILRAGSFYRTERSMPIVSAFALPATHHFERSRPTFSSAFAPAKASAWQRNLFTIPRSLRDEISLPLRFQDLLACAERNSSPSPRIRQR